MQLRVDSIKSRFTHWLSQVKPLQAVQLSLVGDKKWTQPHENNPHFQWLCLSYLKEIWWTLRASVFVPLCDDRAWVLLYDSGCVGVETQLAKLLMHDSGVLVFSVSLKDWFFLREKTRQLNAIEPAWKNTNEEPHWSKNDEWRNESIGSDDNFDKKMKPSRKC